MDSEARGDRKNESRMETTYRPTVGDIKEYVSCSICKGILRRAVTINHCLHSFCRKCLLRHLRRSKVCPKCLVLIHPLTPSINIRSDYVLQRLVYKLFPNLFNRELEKQRTRNKTHCANQGEASDAKTKRDFDEKLAIFTGNETVSLCLQLSPSSEEKERQEEVNVRYLQCQSAVTIEILKRFIENKLALGPNLEVKIFYKNNLIADAYTIADIAYSYGWAQVDPMLLSYTIFHMNPRDRESSVCSTQLYRESRGEHQSMGGFSSSMSSGTLSSSGSNLGTTVAPPLLSHTFSAASATLDSERIPKKRGRKPKKRNCSPVSSPPPKKSCQVQGSEPSFHQSFLSPGSVPTFPGKLSDNGVNGDTQESGDMGMSKQSDVETSRNAGSVFNHDHRDTNSSDGQVMTEPSDTAIDGSRLQENCKSVNKCSRNDSTPVLTDSVLLHSSADSASKDSVTTVGRVGSELESTPGEVFPSEIPTVPSGNPPVAKSAELTENSQILPQNQTAQAGKEVADISGNFAKSNRPFLELLPIVHKEQKQELKTLDRDIRDASKDTFSKDDFLPSIGGQSESSQAVRSTGGREDSFCPHCGQKEESIDGRTSVSSRKCGNCLCINTSITVFINRAETEVPKDRLGFGGSQKRLPIEHPQELPVTSNQKKLPSGNSLDAIVPKIEFPDYYEGDDHQGQLSLRQLEKACAQRRYEQPPVDPRDPSGLQTKRTGQSPAAVRSTLGQPNGFPSRDRVTADSSSDTAAETLVVSSMVSGQSWSSADRCTATAAAPTGNKCSRKQKSLETIIRQLQPRQMSPVANGNGGGPRIVMATPAVGPAVISGPGPCSSAESTRCGKVRAMGEGVKFSVGVNPGHHPQKDNRPNSLLRKALTCSVESFDFRCRRFSSPSKTEVRPNPSYQTPFNLLAPPIKRLKSMFDGLNASTSNEENRRQLQSTAITLSQSATARDTKVPAVQRVTAPSTTRTPEGRPCDVIRRHPNLVLTSANGYDAPLELTTKESRDRKWRESSKKSDSDVLRTSFPLTDNR